MTRRRNDTAQANAVDAGAPAPHAAEDVDDLRSYVKLKHAVAREVRGLHRELVAAGAAEAGSSCHGLMSKLAEDRFTLAVVGQFNRGKSSLMNAIIGYELLPTGILPLTSAITVVRFGPTPRLVVTHEGSSLEIDAPVSALADYVTESGNPGNEKRVRTVYVECPSGFLRPGLEFVDTPGIGSLVEANTATTLSFVPQCDAVLFVTSVEAPLGEVEIDFLSRLRTHVRKVFLVVNKMDILSPTEHTQMVRFVSTNVARRLEHTLTVFPLSSRQALLAKSADDAVGLQESGLPLLEATLATFLASERRSAFLAGILDRADRLIAPGRTATSQERRASIRALRSRLVTGQEDSGPPPAPAAEMVPLAAASMDSSAPAEVVDLDTARTCPLCRRVCRALFDFLARWQYALATDEASQAAFAAEGGFCPLHSWQLASVGSPQGLSTGCAALLERLSSDLERLATAIDTAAPAGLTADSGSCRACRFVAASERDHVRWLVDALQTAANRSAYARSSGVCLRHLTAVVPRAPDEEARRFLLHHAARRLDQLADDVQSYAMKHDGTRRYLQNGDERDAQLRAWIQVNGQKPLSSPWDRT